MYCMVCNKHVADCTCSDIKERLAAVTGRHLAIRMCRKCGEHYSRCHCEEPDFEIRGGTRDGS